MPVRREFIFEQIQILRNADRERTMYDVLIQIRSAEKLEPWRGAYYNRRRHVCKNFLNQNEVDFR